MNLDLDFGFFFFIYRMCVAVSLTPKSVRLPEYSDSSRGQVLTWGLGNVKDRQRSKEPIRG